MTTPEEAIPRIRSGATFGAEELTASGLLAWINYTAFHAYGFSLAIDASSGDFTLIGDGNDSFLYPRGVGETLRALAKITMEPEPLGGTVKSFNNRDTIMLDG
jgi:hypothetical protein